MAIFLRDNFGEKKRNREVNLSNWKEEKLNRILGLLTVTKTLEEILLLFSASLHPTPWPTFRKLDSTGELDLGRKGKPLDSQQPTTELVLLALGLKSTLFRMWKCSLASTSNKCSYVIHSHVPKKMSLQVWGMPDERSEAEWENNLVNNLDMYSVNSGIVQNECHIHP